MALCSRQEARLWLAWPSGNCCFFVIFWLPYGGSCLSRRKKKCLKSQHATGGIIAGLKNNAIMYVYRQYCFAKTNFRALAEVTNVISTVSTSVCRRKKYTTATETQYD